MKFKITKFKFFEIKALNITHDSSIPKCDFPNFSAKLLIEQPV